MPIPFDEEPFDQAHFLRLIENLFPQDYLEGLRANPDSGYELVRAMAAVAARASQAVQRLEQGSLALYALGGTRARATVSLARPDDTHGDFTVDAGTVVSTGIGGRSYVTLSTVTFAGFDLGPFTVDVEAVARGWEWNLRGPYVTAGGEAVPGPIDTISTLRTTPNFADPRVTVEQITPATGGAAPMLDALAGDHLLSRGPSESDASLSFRVRTLPDTVSPGAVLRFLHSLLDPFGLPFDLIETFEHRYQECWDAPSPNVGTPTYQAVPPTNPDFDDAVFAYDDGRDVGLYRNRWLSDIDYRAAFIVVLSNAITLRDTGLAYDDPGTAPTDFHPVAGRPWRQTPAYDTANIDPPSLVFGPAYDGYEAVRGGIYAAIAANLERVKAAGVDVAVVDLNG